MTSQPMNIKDKQQFKQYFRRFIFGQSNSYESLSAVNSIPNIEKKLVDKNLIESRKHVNLTAKQQMYLNSVRYAEVYRLSRQANNPQLVWKNPDWMIEIYGFSLNTSAFLATIELLGDQKQVQLWRKLVLTGKVIGGYGQTQLGHGSNVQMLETQALYNDQKGTFFINTPKNTATKFWPGCFGIFSTHCVLQAKTIVKGKNIGVQTFIVPLRDQYLNSFSGVQAGDIGPKIGFSKVDNGYVKLSNIQVARQNMLSRYVQVLQNGQVLGLQNKQAIKYGYGSMLNLRVKLVVGFALAYTYIPAISQYQINQKCNNSSDPFIKKRLIQVFSTSIGTLLSNIYVTKIFNQFLQNLSAKNYQKADGYLITCHIISSTFKALCSWRAQQFSRQLLTMNEFGTFQSTYLPKTFTDVIPSVTYEGDNSVLLQQTAKFILMKQKDNQIIKPKLEVDSNNLNEVLTMFKYITSSQIRNLKSLIQGSVQNGKDFKVVWNELYQSKILQVSKLWGRMTQLFSCIQTLKNIKEYRHYFETISKVYASVLISQTKEIPFYGFKLTESVAWKDFSQDELQVLRNLNRPVKKVLQPLKYQSRGSKDVADWIYSKL